MHAVVCALFFIKIVMVSGYSATLLLPLQSSLSIKEKKNILATEKVTHKSKLNFPDLLEADSWYFH